MLLQNMVWVLCVFFIEECDLRNEWDAIELTGVTEADQETTVPDTLFFQSGVVDLLVVAGLGVVSRDQLGK